MTSDRRPYADEGEVIASLTAIRASIHDMDRRLTQQQDRIEAQTISTNGRVRGLEMWRAFLSGAIAILGLALGWIGFLVSYIK